jgi:hypothetical protein
MGSWMSRIWEAKCHANGIGVARIRVRPSVTKMGRVAPPSHVGAAEWCWFTARRASCSRLGRVESLPHSRAGFEMRNTLIPDGDDRPRAAKWDSGHVTEMKSRVGLPPIPEVSRRGRHGRVGPAAGIGGRVVWPFPEPYRLTGSILSWSVAFLQPLRTFDSGMASRSLSGRSSFDLAPLRRGFFRSV